MARVTTGGGSSPAPKPAPTPPRPSPHTVKTKPYPNETPPPAPRKAAPKRVAGSSKSSGGSYVVRNGDTLGAIAARYGMSVSQLAAMNGIRNPNLIYAGQRLRLSGSASGGGSTSHASSGGGGSTSSKSTKDPSDNPAADKAATFGYTLGFFNINQELKDLLHRAVQKDYSSSRFVAELQNTKWFRTTSESKRKYEALKASDPSTFSEKMKETQAHILQTGSQMGAVLSPSAASHLADQAMMMSWTDEELKNVLDGMLTTNKGFYTGEAGAFQTQFDQVLGDYGVSVSNSTVGNWIKQAVLGGQTADSVKNMVQQLAQSKYPSLAKRINDGETVRQIADPYIQSYGKILEQDPDNIKLEDPLIQKALQSKDAKGQPTTQTLYDFENTLRNDPRWAKTQNAQDVMSSTAHGILTDMGLV